MNRLEEKIKSPTYHYTKFQNKLYGEIVKYVEQTEGMNRSKLADKLGVTKGYISQIINNGADHKLSKLIKLSLAIGKIPQLEFLSAEEFLSTELQKREDNQPLDLNSMEDKMARIEMAATIKKEDHKHDFSSAKPISAYEI